MEEVEIVRGASPILERSLYLAGEQTPVFFGSAVHNIGVRELLHAFVEYAPEPQPRVATSRIIEPKEEKFTGFVFKIQANMDPAHRDRIAFMRVCSGVYDPGIRLYHSRLGREFRISDAITFLASDRQHTDQAYAGDIIGLHNHGTINIGDSFSQGEKLTFTGIPNFAPELFRRAVLSEPLKLKALKRGLAQLCEEGATQLFQPLTNNDLILGAIGPLQFDVAAFRLRNEYGVDCQFEPAKVNTVRWITAADEKLLLKFKHRLMANLADDYLGHLVYLAPSAVSLNLTKERWPDISFQATQEHIG